MPKKSETQVIMLIVRPIKESDASAFIELVYSMGLGMRSLPKSKPRLMQKIAQSIDSFKKAKTLPERERYIFVLEETLTGELAGTCSIWTAKATYWQERFYRIETSPSTCPWTGAVQEVKTLNVVLPQEDLSESGSLYLNPSFRHQGVGPLISLSRFLFAAGHLNRFFPKIVAELRGVIHPDQTAPFWDSIGRHFCDASFAEVMTHLDRDNSVIAKILPAYPIYISLLPQEVQQTIGTIHDSTSGALAMLMKEGFKMTNDIDLFDGGPKVEANLTDLHVVKESQMIVLGEVSMKSIEGVTCLFSNDLLDFRACYGTMQVKSNGEAILTKEVAVALNLAPGDSFRALLS
jgi:arginine N-succinyltransferase